jgi:hypothetical protein
MSEGWSNFNCCLYPVLCRRWMFVTYICINEAFWPNIFQHLEDSVYVEHALAIDMLQ